MFGVLIVFLAFNFHQFFKKIIFVSTNLKISERKKIPKSVKIIIRKNIGYDFYSYKWGFEYYLKELKNNFNNENLFFLNSSVLFVEKKRLKKNVKK